MNLITEYLITLIRTFSVIIEIKILNIFKKAKTVGVKKIILCYLESDEQLFKEYKNQLRKFGLNKLDSSNPSIFKRFYSTGYFKLNTKNIKLKQNLNEFNLRQYLFKFFNETNFNTNYIYILVKINSQEVFEFKTMYYKTIINLNNLQDKINYINNVIKYFNNYILLN